MNWRPWVGVEHSWIGSLSLRCARQRRLFFDEYGPVLYMGERVVRQHSWDFGELRSPVHPHIDTRFAASMGEGEKEILTGGLDYTDFLIPMGDYDDFVRTRLQPPPLGASARGERASGSRTTRRSRSRSSSRPAPPLVGDDLVELPDFPDSYSYMTPAGAFVEEMIDPSDTWTSTLQLDPSLFDRPVQENLILKSIILDHYYHATDCLNVSLFRRFVCPGAG